MMKKLFIAFGISVLLMTGCNLSEAGIKDGLEQVSTEIDIMQNQNDEEYLELRAVYEDYKKALEEEVLDCPTTTQYQEFSKSLVTKIDDTHYRVRATVDTQNVMGAMVRSTISMIIEYDEDGLHFRYYDLQME